MRTPNYGVAERRGLRILMVLHMPWLRELGGPRVQVELSEYLRGAGHQVDKLSADDLPSVRHGRVGALMGPSFARRAAQQLRAVASSYDVIDAHQGCIIQSKRELGFGGVLVVRSAGLAHRHAAFTDEARRRWPEERHGRLPTRLFADRQTARLLREVETSF